MKEFMNLINHKRTKVKREVNFREDNYFVHELNFENLVLCICLALEQEKIKVNTDLTAKQKF